MRLLLAVLLLAGCGGGKFDGSWTGTWSGLFEGGAPTSGTIDVTIAGGKVEGAAPQFTIKGSTTEAGAATLDCSGRCWGYDFAGSGDGTLSEVAGHLRGSLLFHSKSIAVDLDLKAAK